MGEYWEVVRGEGSGEGVGGGESVRMSGVLVCVCVYLCV